MIGANGYNLDLNTLRVITLVREFALKDYHKKRAWLHDRWLKDSESLWKNNKVILSYPDFPVYPTESEILSTAKEIIELLKNPVTDAEIKAAEATLERPSSPQFPMEPTQPPMPTEPPVEKVDAEVVEDIGEEIQDEMPRILEKLYDTRHDKNQSQ